MKNHQSRDGGGHVVSLLPFYSDYASSNPTEVYSFYPFNCLKRTKINKKMPEMVHALEIKNRLQMISKEPVC